MTEGYARGLLMVLFFIAVVFQELLFVPMLFAHDTGNSFEQVFGAYKVDVGYDSAPFTAGEPVRFDFNVTKEQSGEQTDFTDVWVRVYQDSKTVFATGLHKPALGVTGLTFTFPEGGQYSLSTRFQNSGQTVVEAVFPLTVQPSMASVARDAALRNIKIINWIGWGVAGACLGLCAWRVFRRKR